MRYSHQREVIKKVVQNTNSHPTADWVFNQTKKIIPNISLGTVYRNLKRLEEEGEMNTIYDGNIDIKKLSPNYILSVINGWKNKGLYPEKVLPSKKNIFEKGILKIYEIYQTKLRDLNACDFGDLILHCVSIFENNKDILEIFHKIRSAFLPTAIDPISSSIFRAFAP